MITFKLIEYLLLITMPDCKNCGNHISDDFKRVFADDNGEVRACPNCAAQAGIAEESMSRR
jgi:hypothetical protein